MREITIGILASMFFAVTFILNRSMELAGGSWLWSSSLRFLFMLPFLFLIVMLRGNVQPVLQEIKRQPVRWFGWSFVGFVLFYAPITYAAAYGPGWLVAGTWQLTIVAGVLLGPLFHHMVQTDSGPVKVRHRIPGRALMISLFILAGIVIIQSQQADDITPGLLAASVLPVVLAAFAYPLGNRKMMELCGGRLDTFQRVFGMTLASLPCWLVIAAAGYMEAGPPTAEQLLQTFIVAVCSGVIATTLFFIATDRVRNDQGKLAAVEATQSTQVMFVMAGEVIFLAAPLPGGAALTGLAVIMAGMLLHSLYARR
ncbi:multidrug resistance efflux transporter family protein [Paenibacillus sambharensis]|uniref:Multidrug resistance efflux transporter family protein n=1 Tax=Paenibacillus sambharensis TaxID=1803190 RepID=A0A2W1LUV1_9BACL|nr:multidrug resistance efflux transporter family protein [Paenibacillus sambharensis]PZD95561.1 multidrug resistance efflux transporter family protein [Paenibacillus sambharensis]